MNSDTASLRGTSVTAMPTSPAHHKAKGASASSLQSGASCEEGGGASAAHLAPPVDTQRPMSADTQATECVPHTLARARCRCIAAPAAHTTKPPAPSRDMIASFDADDVADLLPSSPVQLPRRLSHTFARELSSHFLSFLNIQAPGSSTVDENDGDDAASASTGRSPSPAARSPRSSRRRRASIRGQRPSSPRRPSSGSPRRRSNSPRRASENNNGASPNASARVLPPSVDRTRVRRTSSISRRRRSTGASGKSPRGSRRSDRRKSSAARRSVVLQLAIDNDPTDSQTDSIEEDYLRCRRELRVFRKKLTEQSEVNFRLERKLRQLDERIGLLISHRISVEEIDAKLLDYDFTMHKGGGRVGEGGKKGSTRRVTTKSAPETLTLIQRISLARQIPVRDADAAVRLPFRDAQEQASVPCKPRPALEPVGDT